MKWKPRPTLAGIVRWLSWLLAIDGLLYLLVTIATPVKADDLYTGSPVVYLALAAGVALLLLGAALMLVLWAFIEGDTRRWRSLGLCAAGLLGWLVCYALVGAWIDWQIHG